MNSFISWVGGKKFVRKRIIAEFPKNFDRYIEVFGGAGWVLFGADRHANFEVFNDINSDLINLYRCVKYHPAALQIELDGILNSRELFFDYISQLKCNGLTDIQRAARYFITIKCSFGSKMESFATEKSNINKTIDQFQAVQERLKDVVIENRNYEQIIKTYDRDAALFYLDPPYYKTEKYYAGDFSENDHINLRDILEKIKGKFVLSYNDSAFIRDLYKNYNIIGFERCNTLSSVNASGYKELIIKNF